MLLCLLLAATHTKEAMASEAKQDPESDPNPSFRFDQNESQQSLLSRNGSGYESQYGSLFGSRFSLTDGSGIFVSSLALTIIISAIAVVGIILVAVIITLAVMLSSCENSTVNLHSKGFSSDICASYRLNLELNNIQRWDIPLACESHISHYIHGGQYSKDVEVAVDAVRKYLKNLKLDNDQDYAVILDIDDTALSHSHYYGDPVGGSIGYNNFTQGNVMDKTKVSPIVPVLNLYHEIRAANWSIFFISERPENTFNLTKQNLIEAGYESWTSLILRSQRDAGLSVQAYKTNKMHEVEKQGYQILCVLGDQWSDIIGSRSTMRTFKLPNPMYQIL